MTEPNNETIRSERRPEKIVIQAVRLAIIGIAIDYQHRRRALVDTSDTPHVINPNT